MADADTIIYIKLDKTGVQRENDDGFRWVLQGAQWKWRPQEREYLHLKVILNSMCDNFNEIL